MIFQTLDLSPEEQKKKNEEKYSAIRKVITLMIHCIDCDDEECALMPYCLDYQDLLVHMEECTEKKCRMKVRFYTDEILRVVRDLSRFIFLNQCRKEADPTYKDSEFEFSIESVESVSISESLYVGSAFFRH